MDESLRQRAQRKLIRVTFPNGKSFCYANVTTTFIEVLKEIGSSHFAEIPLEMCHLPLVSQEKYPKYEKWMKEIVDGWYLNAQSNTDTKYLQLRAIGDALKIGYKVELGIAFTPQDNTNKRRSTKSMDKLLVRFPDGEFIASNNPIETFLQTLWKIGIDDIKRRDIYYCNKPLITLSKISNAQAQVDTNKWATVPYTTKDKAKMLKLIAIHMKINLEVTII